MLLQETRFEEWKYPPTVAKSSGRTRRPFDYKHIIHLESDLFEHPVLMMSDLHQHSMDIARRLSEEYDLSELVILSAGDMAGKGFFGSNGDPTPTYEYFAQRAKAFYFVQGNHDLPGHQNAHLKLKNSDGTRCMIPDGKVVKTILGNIAGINGIVTRSSKPRLYKFLPDDYFQLAEDILKRGNIDIFMTHDTPAIPIKMTEEEYREKARRYNGDVRTSLNGKEPLFELVDRYKPKIHIYGHCHHRTYSHYINGVQYINVDARLIFIHPKNE